MKATVHAVTLGVLCSILIGCEGMGAAATCNDDVISCKCGLSLTVTTTINIRRCVDRHGRCEPCDGLPYTRDSICLQFHNCATCSVERNGGCKTCPPGFYGKTCLFEQSCGKPPAISNGFVEAEDWAEGSHATYFCERDWMLTGDWELVCGEGQWSGKTPTCLRSCGPPPKAANGIQSGATNWTEGGMAAYRCATGDVMRGDPRLLCRGGQWQGETPSCVASCGEPPVVPNGSLRGIFWGEGGTVEYTCNDGRTMSGDSRLVCRGRRWRGTAPSCATTCGAPPSVPHGRHVGTFWGEGGTVTYSCNARRTVSGDAQLVCRNGKWTGTVPSCRRTCARPTVANTDISPRKSQYSANAQITMTCSAGFATGQSRNSLRLTCLATGRWSAQFIRCKAVTSTSCAVPQHPVNGKVVLRRGQTNFQPGQSASFTCDTGYILSPKSTVTCQDGGTWSGRFPRCVKVITCTDPGVPTNGKRVISSPASSTGRSNKLSRRRVGARTLARFTNQRNAPSTVTVDIPPGQFRSFTKLTFSCNSTSYTLEGSTERTCQSTGKWTGQQPSCVPVCGRAASGKVPKIVNGKASRIGDWPWTAFIAFRVFGDRYFGACAGTFIGGNWIITAAHCVRGRSADRIKVYLGKYYRDYNKDDSLVQEFRVSEIHISPVFNPSLLDADVALLRLKGSVKLTQRVSPICLSSLDSAGVRETENLMRPGTTITVVGWGQTEKRRAADLLRVARIQTVSNAVCEQQYAQANVPLRVTANMFCAGRSGGGVDACYGDSGGPAMAISGTGKNRKWHLVGIVSWGSPIDCALAGQYGGYTRISRFFTYIRSKTGL